MRFWHVRIVSFSGCWLQLNNMCCMAVLPIDVASLEYLTWETFIAHWILFLVSVCCVVTCTILRRRCLPVLSWQSRTHDWFGARVSRSEPDRSKCTEKVVSLTFATSECRFVSAKTPFIILISNVYPSVTVYGIIISHSALRMFWMSAWSSTKAASGGMQPFWVFVALAMVMAVQKCECLTWCIGDTDDQ